MESKEIQDIKISLTNEAINYILKNSTLENFSLDKISINKIK